MWVWANTYHANYTPAGKVAKREGDRVTVTFDLFGCADTPTVSWFTKLQPCALAQLYYGSPTNARRHTHTHTFHRSFSHTDE